eukprot:6120478-Alexandrium_andersonii.AAC.1
MSAPRSGDERLPRPEGEADFTRKRQHRVGAKPSGSPRTRTSTSMFMLARAIPRRAQQARSLDGRDRTVMGRFVGHGAVV